MDFFGSGISVGRYFGITVRLHFTFLLVAIKYLFGPLGIGFGLAFLVGLYGCVLLHEFGHALVARWCDGEVEEILLWPLGGLAFCRPAWHPTAHLLTTVAGPLVTLVLWLVFWGASAALLAYAPISSPGVYPLYWFCATMMWVNKWLLLFNLIPAFPMDGGRMLRDTLWHFISATTATTIAVRISQVLAGVGLVFAIYRADYTLMLFAGFILWQASAGHRVVGFEAGGAYEFSLTERIGRGRRRRQFFHAVQERQQAAATAAFHGCATCGRTDHDHPALDFRVCTDCSGGQEYCPDHLDNHRHV